MTEGRVLGVDPGEKRIGFALSDDLRMTVRPLEVWKHKSLAKDVGRVRSLVEEHAVVLVVVGVPIKLDGTESKSTARARKFVEALREALEVDVVTRDEALTTWEAEARMRELGIPPKRGLVDAYAAAVILEEELRADD